MTRKQITFRNKEYIVRHAHYRPPEVYGVVHEGEEGQALEEFVVFDPKILEPIFREDNHVLRHSKNRRMIFTDRGDYSRARQTYSIQRKSYIDCLKIQLKSLPGKLVLAKFITKTSLYRLDEWLENPPVIIKKGGERVVVSEGTKPEPRAVGLSFCSLKEKHYSKKLGRDISLGRALKRLEFLTY